MLEVQAQDFRLANLWYRMSGSSGLSGTVNAKRIIRVRRIEFAGNFENLQFWLEDPAGGLNWVYDDNGLIEFAPAVVGDTTGTVLVSNVTGYTTGITVPSIVHIDGSLVAPTQVVLGPMHVTGVANRLSNPDATPVSGLGVHGPTGERPTATAVPSGSQYWNETTGQLQVSDETNWITVGP